jgi:predicted anti-sigma-YlaC factor YlaD
VIALFDRSCARHRAVLLESVDGRWEAASPAALAHLDRCTRCERELSLTALTLAGLRRLAAESRYVEPSPDGWILIRGRLQRPAPARWPVAFGLGKAVVSVGVLVTMIAPSWIGGANQQVGFGEPTASVTRPAGPQSRATVKTIPAAARDYEKGPRKLNPTAHTTRVAPSQPLSPPAPASPGRTK